MLQRRIKKALDLREGHDGVFLPFDFALAHAEDRAAEIDVLAAGQLGMKSRAHFQQAADTAVNFREAGGGPGDAREQLQQRGFPGAVAADQPDDFALFHVEGHIAQRPDKILGFARATALEGRGEGARDYIAQGEVALAFADAIAFAQSFHVDDGFSHFSRPRPPWSFPFSENMRRRSRARPLPWRKK